MKSVFEILRARPGMLPLLLLCAFLSACATPFKAETTVFHQWPNHTSSTMAFKFALPPTAEQTLERSAYENVLRQMLVAKGFREGADAHLVLTFSYTSNAYRRLVDSEPFGRVGVWGGGGFRHGGFVLGGTLPLGGYGVRDIVLQERTLKLVFVDEAGGNLARLYEGKAMTLDGGRDALAALPYLVRALLEDFPGPSGATRQVQIPVAR